MTALAIYALFTAVIIFVSWVTSFCEKFGIEEDTMDEAKFLTGLAFWPVLIVLGLLTKGYIIPKFLVGVFKFYVKLFTGGVKS